MQRTDASRLAQLRIAQPALSRQVQDLEHEIGVDLVRRSRRGVSLKAEGSKSLHLLWRPFHAGEFLGQLFRVYRIDE